MNSLIKHFNNCLKIQQLFKKTETDELAENLYWYDLTIKYASSKFGFLQIFFGEYVINLQECFLFLKKKILLTVKIIRKKTQKIMVQYYHKAIKKIRKIFQILIWNFKILISKPWYEDDKWSNYLENCDIIKNELHSSKFKTIEHPGNQMLAENGKWSSIILIEQKASLEYENDF